MNMVTSSQTPAVQPPAVILGRTSLSRSGFAPEVLARHCGTLLRQAETLRRHGGGVLAVAHPPELHTGALLLGAALYGRLRFDAIRGSVGLYRAAMEAALPPAKLPDWLVVQDLEQDPSLLEWLSARRLDGTVVIATASWGWWEQQRIELPLAIAPFTAPAALAADLEQAQAAAQAEEVGALRTLEDAQRQVYRSVALFDAWGVPLPFGLLARSLHPDAATEAEIDAAEEAVGTAVAGAEATGLLHWIELDRPPGLAVATRMPLLARAGLASLLAGQDPRPELARLIAAVDAADQEQRVAVLRLMQAVTAAGARWPTLASAWQLQCPHGEWVRALYSDLRQALNGLFADSTSREILAWAGVLHGLGEPAVADAVLAHALRSEPDNAALLQSRARLLGRWARRERRHAEAAGQAFAAAASTAPNNPYVWQARGVWALDMGDPDTAVQHLKRALACAESAAERVYALIALADAALALGRPDAADQWLNEAARIAPTNPYVPHVRGEAARWRGDFQAAVTAYAEALDLDPRNVPAAQSLGDMALKRGHWRRAEGHLSDALSWQADNVPARHALGELRAEQAIAARDAGDDATAEALFEAAETAYRAVLDTEPGNQHALLGLAVLSAKRGRPTAAAQRIAQLREQDAGNPHALHTLARIRAAAGQLDAAERLCNDILYGDRYRDRTNLPALLLLADIDVKRGADLGGRIQRVEQAMGGQPLAAADRAKAMNALALMERDSGEAAAALARLRANQAEDPANTYTLMALAETLDATGDAAEAAALRTEAARLRQARRG